MFSRTQIPDSNFKKITSVSIQTEWELEENINKDEHLPGYASTQKSSYKLSAKKIEQIKTTITTHIPTNTHRIEII